MLMILFNEDVVHRLRSLWEVRVETVAKIDARSWTAIEASLSGK